MGYPRGGNVQIQTPVGEYVDVGHLVGATDRPVEPDTSGLTWPPKAIVVEFKVDFDAFWGFLLLMGATRKTESPRRSRLHAAYRAKTRRRHRR